MGENILTLMILVDALRPDYIRHTEYISAMASSGITGYLRECFGFLPRAAYFAGMNAEQFGFTNMYCFDPENSPFGISRFFPFSINQPEVERKAGIRNAIEGFARTRTTAYAASYCSSIEIPLDYLPYFDFAEKSAVWDGSYPAETLFHLFDDQHIPWYVCAWPDTNLLSDSSDQAIVEKALREIKPDHRFAYLHLQELDGIGHIFGPSSREIINAVKSTDALIMRLMKGLEQRFSQVDLLLFGDHGMVNVHTPLDLWSILDRSGLKFGIDYIFFLDSTMARFWFYTHQARDEIVRVLSSIEGGRLLDDQALVHFGIDKCDRRNGELYFLADPGILIFPNFFQRHGNMIKGMHGYDPDCFDNLGYLLVSYLADRKIEGMTCGKVDPPQIFNTILELTGLCRKPDCPPSVLSKLDRVPEFKYSRCNHPQADSIVENHITKINHEIMKAIGVPQAIVLTGSFGRGEGGMIVVDDKPVPVNDYDLIVVDQLDHRDVLNNLGKQMAKSIGVDYIDIACSTGEWADLPLTMFNYDLKYGSRVVLGDLKILDRLPAYAARELPIMECVQLFLNRIAGLMTGLQGRFFEGQLLTEDEERYLANQAIKAGISIGDWYLVKVKDYDSSYSIRKERFAQLANAMSLPVEMKCRVTRAYELKLHPEVKPFKSSLQVVFELWRDLKQGLIQACGTISGNLVETLGDAMDAYLFEVNSHRAWMLDDNRMCLDHPILSAVVKESVVDEKSYRAALYSCLPFLLASMVEDDCQLDFLQEASSRLREGFYLPLPEQLSLASWDAIRSKVINWWFEFIH